METPRAKIMKALDKSAKVNRVNLSRLKRRSIHLSTLLKYDFFMRSSNPFSHKYCNLEHEQMKLISESNFMKMATTDRL